MDRLRRCFHPRGLQVGHFRGEYEFLTGEEFIAWAEKEPAQPPGSPYEAEIVSIDVTGDVAGREGDGHGLRDQLHRLPDALQAGGVWRIICKAYFVHGPG
jgi:hypothetical protein